MNAFEQVKGGLIVSCQALEGNDQLLIQFFQNVIHTRNDQPFRRPPKGAVNSSSM